EVLGEKVGVSPAEAERMEARMAEMARQEGFAYTLDRPVANSFDVHRILRLAADHGRSEVLLDRLFEELFGNGTNVFEGRFLVEAAVATGIARERAEAVLAGDDYADAVRADRAEAVTLGATGVPFAVLGDRIAVPGATSVKGYAQAIEHAAAAV